MNLVQVITFINHIENISSRREPEVMDEILLHVILRIQYLYQY